MNRPRPPLAAARTVALPAALPTALPTALPVALPAAFLIALVLLPACAGVPFEEPELCPMDAFDPETVRTEFAAALPESFTLMNTVVFEYYWKSLPALGMLAVDYKEETFALACLNGVGFKIFEITGKGEETTCVLGLPEMEGEENLFSEEDLAGAVGEDIRRIYFDLVPAAEAVAEKEDDLILFRCETGDSVIEHDFGGMDACLLEKRYRDDGDLTTRVRYYQYMRHEGRLFPEGIVLDNKRYGYRLVLRIKEIRD